MAATIEQLRALVQDQDPLNFLLEDVDYTLIIGIEDNIYRAAATICRMLAAKYAVKTKVKAGPVSVEDQQKYEHYADLAGSYDQRAREGGGSGDGSLSGVGGPSLTGVIVSDIEANRNNSSRYRESFFRGVTDYDDAAEATD